jgi:hypothetical protein
MSSTAPLFDVSHLTYAGAFRLPRTASNARAFTFGGGPIAYNPLERTLFAGTRDSFLGEVSIPDPVKAPINDLPFASFVQPITDPCNGKLADLNPNGTDEGLGGCLVTPDGDLLLNARIFYDATNAQRVSHLKRPRNLSFKTDSGWHPVWESTKQGFVAGMMMTAIPSDLQPMLGGTVLTGQTGLPIVTRGSLGPAAFAFDHTRIASDNGELIPAVPLLYYDSTHPTLGPYHPDGANALWNGTMAGCGAAILGRTLVIFGRIGIGRFDYGPGTTNLSLAEPQQRGLPIAPGSKEYWCYDEDVSDKGQHAWPYRFQLWAYDLNELEQVRLGVRQPWEVAPYATWPLSLPYKHQSWMLAGVSHDVVGKRVFVAQSKADTDGFSARAIIHVFTVADVLSEQPKPAEPSEVDILTVEIADLNKQLDALEKSRLEVLEMLEQEEQAHNETKAVIKHAIEQLRQSVEGEL